MKNILLIIKYFFYTKPLSPFQLGLTDRGRTSLIYAVISFITVPVDWHTHTHTHTHTHKIKMDTNAKKCENCSAFFSKLQDLNNSFVLVCTHYGEKVGKGDKVMLTRHDHHLKNCSVTRDMRLCICDLLEESDRFWNYEIILLKSAKIFQQNVNKT